LSDLRPCFPEKGKDSSRDLLDLFCKEEARGEECDALGIPAPGDEDGIGAYAEDGLQVEEVARPTPRVVEKAKLLAEGMGEEGICGNRLGKVRFVHSGDDEDFGIVEREFQPSQEFDCPLLGCWRDRAPSQLTQEESDNSVPRHGSTQTLWDRLEIHQGIPDLLCDLDEYSLSFDFASKGGRAVNRE
jgi:hypothetical protein